MPAHCQCLADFAVSSYIPTLSVLNELHSRAPTNTTNNGVLLVSQPNTPGLKEIPFTTAEVEKTRELLEKQGIRSLLYTGSEATVNVVLESLKSFSWVHFACHASQEIRNPLESAIHLYDRPLTLSEIMKKKLPNAGLAFMSACQTSSGDEKLPEEAVHLAAGMLGAGYRSVVATMWSISDVHAPEVAEIFYKNLLPESNISAAGSVKLDITNSACALHTSVQHLRKKLGNSPKALRAWIPYIHVGI
jgi:CHAT domain-containing protein